jgi:hypothetical protein
MAHADRNTLERTLPILREAIIAGDEINFTGEHNYVYLYEDTLCLLFEQEGFHISDGVRECLYAYIRRMPNNG